MIANGLVDMGVWKLYHQAKGGCAAMGFFHRLRNDFGRGLIIILPIIVTVYLLYLVYNLFVKFAERSFGGVLERYLGSHWWVLGLSILLTLFLVWLVGVLTRNYIGRTLHRYFESLLERVPLINKTYTTVRQVINAIFRTDLPAFKKVVLIEYPRKGVYTLAFITSEEVGRLGTGLEEKDEKRYIAVYAPTSPNPLSGWFLLIPEDEVRYPPITVEEGIKLVLSGGVLVPEAAERLPIPERAPRAKRRWWPFARQRPSGTG